MPLTEIQELRQMLGETVPAGGTEADTMFTDVDIQDFLDKAPGDFNSAAYYGWRAKWAEFSNLVNTSTGSARDDLGKLADEAKKQLDYYGGLSGLVTTVTTAGRTRIGRIVR